MIIMNDSTNPSREEFRAMHGKVDRSTVEEMQMNEWLQERIKNAVAELRKRPMGARGPFRVNIGEENVEKTTRSAQHLKAGD